MAQDAEMTAGTARGARQVPGPGGSSSAASLSLRDLKLWGLGRDAHPSSLLGKTPSGAPGTELESVCLSSLGRGAAFFPGFWGGRGAGVPGKAPLWLWGDPVWCGATQVLLGGTGLAAEGYGTSTRPDQAGGIFWHTGTAMPRYSRYSRCPWECTALEPSPRCLLLPPRFAARIKPNMFPKAFNF